MKDARRARLTHLFETTFKGDRAKFMKATGLTKGRITQLFDPKEPFGELAARRLAEQLGLRPDYFEAADASVAEPVAPYGVKPPPAKPAPGFKDPVNDTGWQVMHDLEDLHPDDKAAWIAELHRQAEKAREISRMHSARLIDDAKKGAKKV